MNSLLIAVGAAIFYVIAYHTYGKYIARKIFEVSLKNVCPSTELRDDVDFVPTPKKVLFGHHFASIAGTGPIVGPAIAVIWGWVPALLWVLLGSVFMGAVHDFGALIISLRNQGKSIGDIAGDLISPRVKTLFLLIIFFLNLIVIAIFGVVIAACFSLFPDSVFPIWVQIPIAIILGKIIMKNGDENSRFAKIAVLISVIIMYGTIFVGTKMPLEMPEDMGIDPVKIWVILLLIYAYIASILPVQTLLQPRDFLNSYQLIISLVLLAVGVVVAHPTMVAPEVNTNVSGALSFMPMIFVTIACGAISGFHSLVASGTSSKQCLNEHDAMFIGYGSMLTEGMLAVFVIIACCAGLGLGFEKNGEFLTGANAFNAQYADWTALKGLAAKLNAFITGSSNMIAKTGIPFQWATTIMGVFIAAFAATTLDSATRIQRYIVGELAMTAKMPFLAKKHPATLIAVGSALGLAFVDGTGKGAAALWPLFGSLNQLLSGLALLVLTIYLASRKKNYWLCAVPMVFMFVMTFWAMEIKITDFYSKNNYLLLAISVIIIIFQIWMMIESCFVFRKIIKSKK
ncbi:carbon starvation protein A [Lentisphaerota bacterium WC36G]|nr:carbon starvation protein A [Lentisphaerae bacterium WC36]